MAVKNYFINGQEMSEYHFPTLGQHPSVGYPNVVNYQALNTLK